MEQLIVALQQVFAPLSVELIGGAIAAGVCLGVFYNYPLNIDPKMIFHKLIAGWTFILFIFIFRLVSSAFGSNRPQVNSYLGWVGIALLWGLFCLAIYVTDLVAVKLLEKKIIHR